MRPWSMRFIESENGRLMVTQKLVARGDAVIENAIIEFGVGAQAHSLVLDAFIGADESSRVALFLALAARFVGGDPFAQATDQTDRASAHPDRRGSDRASAPADDREALLSWARSTLDLLARQLPREGR